MKSNGNKNEFMIEFKLKEADYVELDKLLKHLHLAGTGGKAHSLIENGKVWVNGEKENRKRRKLRQGDQVIFGPTLIQIKI